MRVDFLDCWLLGGDIETAKMPAEKEFKKPESEASTADGAAAAKKDDKKGKDEDKEIELVW